MVHGYNDARNFHYSIGYFNGDGQNFKNADNNFDLMMRGWVAPFRSSATARCTTRRSADRSGPATAATRWRSRTRPRRAVSRSSAFRSST